MDDAGRAALVEALRSSQRLGMLGDRPIDDVVTHADAFVSALVDVTGTVVDLGAGGGVPGLVVAVARPDLRLVLIDRRARRTDQLRRLVARLGVGERVDVVTGDVDDMQIAWAGRADAVIARGFGPPRSTLRAAAPLVAPGGLIVISEPPPTSADRWPPPLLAALGVRRRPSDPRVAVFRRAVPRGT